MTRRRYTNNERATAVAAVSANNGSVNETARKLGIPETSLRQWCSGQRHPELQPLSEQKKLELADQFGQLAELLLGVVRKKADQLDAKSAAIAAAVCIDKALLLQGQATSISESRTTTEAADRLALLREHYGRAQEIRTLQPEDIEAARKLLGNSVPKQQTSERKV